MNQPPQRTEVKEPVNASDREQVESRQKSAKARELRRLAGLKQVMASADGRVWLWDLLSFCGISRTSFTGNSTTFFNEGQRNVGLKVQADLTKHYPDQYLAMIKEADNA